jgi:hypothetical protein
MHRIQVRYMGYSSRLLRDPLAVIIRGRSSSGKTTLAGKVAILFPFETKIETMTFTDASLFNTEQDYFTNKIFITGERRHAKDDNAKDRGSLLRQLLSEKRINRLVSVRIPATHQWETVRVERQGPIAYSETTTSHSIFEEDLNRMLQLYPDDSEQQNRRVMDAVAGKYNPYHTGAVVDVEAIKERHHNFQHELQGMAGIRVGIPYADYLAAQLPAGKTECRRAIQQVFTLIECLVLLQQDRRQEQNGFHLATVEDYKVARRLLLGPLQSSLGLGKDYKKANRLKTAIRKQVFSSLEVQNALGLSKMSANNLLNGLRRAGLLERLTEGVKASPATWRWTEQGNDKLETMLETLVLPTVAEVKKYVNT